MNTQQTEQHDPLTGLTEEQTRQQDPSTLGVIRDTIHDMTCRIEQIVDVKHDGTEAGNLADALAEAKELQSKLGMVVSLLTSELASCSEVGETWHCNGYELRTSNRAKKTVWDHQLLLPNVLSRIADEREADPETGEMERYEDAAARVLPTVYAMTPSAAPKKTGLAGLGIDPEPFRHVEWGAKTVTVKPAQQESSDPR